MKIVSLHISSFGQLKNLHLDFIGGVNVIQQKNGFGKTTIANFVRAMLYGFDYKRVKRGTESVTDAALWTTWLSNEKIGGSMVLEQEGINYRVERYFGLTAKSESLNVVNLQTGKSLNISEVGQYFLGLTAESYDRSAYIPQEAVEISSNENFDTRLAGLVQNAEDYEGVQDKLRKYRKDLKYERGDGGVIFNLENRRMQLQRQLTAGEQAKQRHTQIENRLKEISAQRKNLETQYQSCAEKISVLQQTVAQNSAAGNGSREKLQQLQAKLARFEDMESDKAACDALASKADMPSLAKKQRPLHIPLLIAALCLVAVGVGLCFWLLAAGIPTALVGVALAVASFFVKPALTTLPSGEKEYYITEYFNIASKYFDCRSLDFKEVQRGMQQAYNTYVGDVREFQVLQQTVDKFSDDSEAIPKLRQNQQLLAEIQLRQQALSREEGSLTAECKTLVSDTTVVREQLSEVEQNLAEAKHRYEIAMLTSQLLTQAKENLSVGYLPKLCQRCGELLQQITNGDYLPVIDRNFAIKLQHNGVTKALDNFSRGIREITLLCFRLALSEVLFDGNIPFVIIDDAFVNFDEENFVRATTLLRQLSDTQVLYFTCHARLGNLK